jgi:hypothetical protein
MSGVKRPKTIIALYSGKVVNMDYLIPRGVSDKQRFSLACARVMDNAGKGHVVEDGKVYSLSEASRMAQIVTDPEIKARILAAAGGAALEPNASGVYYVWVLRQGTDEPLSAEGPYGPMGLKVAEQNARIGAQKGIHDRAVSRGHDPEAKSFQIVARYAARTGHRIA